MERSYKNKRIEMSAKELDDYIHDLKTSERHKLKDAILILLILAIGFIGLYFAFPSSNSSIPILLEDGERTYAIATIKNPIPTKKQLDVRINGEREAYEKITFSLEGYHKDATYSIDFGDGTRGFWEGTTIQHKYEKKGTYKIRAVMQYRNDKIFYKKTIKIRPGPALNDNLTDMNY